MTDSRSPCQTCLKRLASDADSCNLRLLRPQLANLLQLLGKKRGVAAALVLLWALFAFSSAFQGLHKYLHGDDSGAQHCSACAVLKGTFAAVAVAVAVLVPLLNVRFVRMPVTFSKQVPFESLTKPGRAPPR